MPDWQRETPGPTGPVRDHPRDQTNSAEEGRHQWCPQSRRPADLERSGPVKGNEGPVKGNDDSEQIHQLLRHRSRSDEDVCGACCVAVAEWAENPRQTRRPTDQVEE